VIVDLADAADADIADWLTNAHSLIAAKLTKLVRRELGLG
jgi:predicted DNA-binding protein (MmcQ/YjbR family)